jgi:signal peptidase I
VRGRLSDWVLDHWRWLALGAAALASVVWIGVGLLYGAYTIPSEAMAPTLEPGDRILVRAGADPARGDVVVADVDTTGTGPRTSVVSRVVATAGERVEARDGVVRVDGQPLAEPYLQQGVTTADFGPVEVPEHAVFLLSDDRARAADSRAYGAVPDDQVAGVVAWRWWPLGRVGGV